MLMMAMSGYIEMVYIFKCILLFRWTKHWARIRCKQWQWQRKEENHIKYIVHNVIAISMDFACVILCGRCQSHSSASPIPVCVFSKSWKKILMRPCITWDNIVSSLFFFFFWNGSGAWCIRFSIISNYSRSSSWGTLSTSEHYLNSMWSPSLFVQCTCCIFAVSENDSFYFQQATTDVTSCLMHNTEPLLPSWKDLVCKIALNV